MPAKYGRSPTLARFQEVPVRRGRGEEEAGAVPGKQRSDFLYSRSLSKLRKRVEGVRRGPEVAGKGGVERPEGRSLEPAQERRGDPAL